MRNAVVGILVVLALLAGIAVGWWGPRPFGPRPLDAEARSEARVRDLEGQVARLEERLAQAEARGQPLSGGAPAPVAPPPPETAAPPSAEGGPGAPSGPAVPEAGAASGPSTMRYAVEGFSDDLRDVDWDAVGRALKEMPALAGQFAQEWGETGKLPVHLVGRLQEANGPLLTAALKVAQKRKIPIEQVSTLFTHPAFAANGIASALAAAGLPLSETQSDGLGRLASQAASEDAQRVRGYSDRTWALQKTIDECLLRERFYEAAFALLSPEQRSLLVSPAARGRLQVDVFSGALLWGSKCQVLAFDGREALLRQMELQALQHFGLPDAQRLAVRDAVGLWADGLPAAWLTTPADPLSKLGMLEVGRIVEAAKHQMRLMQEVIDRTRMDEEAAAKVRAADFTFVPLLSKGS